MAKQSRTYVDQSAEDDSSLDQSIHDVDGDEAHQDEERLSDDNVNTSRESQAREVTSRERSLDDERIASFKNSVFDSALPPIPAMEGFHICWLTTTNPRDSITSRERMGYQLIKAEEIPGFEHTSVKSGPYAGYIGVNEMVAAKLPMHLYQAYMQEAHHDAPLNEEKRLRAVTEVIADAAKAASGKAPLVGDGTKELGKGPSRGKFEG